MKQVGLKSLDNSNEVSLSFVVFLAENQEYLRIAGQYFALKKENIAGF